MLAEYMKRGGLYEMLLLSGSLFGEQISANHLIHDLRDRVGQP